MEMLLLYNLGHLELCSATAATNGSTLVGADLVQGRSLVTATAAWRRRRRRDHRRRGRGSCCCLGSGRDNRQGDGGITAVGPFSRDGRRRHSRLLLLEEVLEARSQISLGDTKVEILKKIYVSQNKASSCVSIKGSGRRKASWQLRAESGKEGKRGWDGWVANGVIPAAQTQQNKSTKLRRRGRKRAKPIIGNGMWQKGRPGQKGGLHCTQIKRTYK